MGFLGKSRPTPVFLGDRETGPWPKCGARGEQPGTEGVKQPMTFPMSRVPRGACVMINSVILEQDLKSSLYEPPFILLGRM